MQSIKFGWDNENESPGQAVGKAEVSLYSSQGEFAWRNILLRLSAETVTEAEGTLRKVLLSFKSSQTQAAPLAQQTCCTFWEVMHTNRDWETWITRRLTFGKFLFNSTLLAICSE